MPYRGACHCGAVTFKVDASPKWLVSCNCSICRRTAALWFHTTTPCVTITGETQSYAWGDKVLAFQRCAHCGCVTHYSPLDGTNRMAVNMRMAEPAAITAIPVRHFDGADTWAYLS